MIRKQDKNISSWSGDTGDERVQMSVAEGVDGCDVWGDSSELSAGTQKTAG